MARIERQERLSGHHRDQERLPVHQQGKDLHPPFYGGVLCLRPAVYRLPDNNIVKYLNAIFIALIFQLNYAQFLIIAI